LISRLKFFLIMKKYISVFGKTMLVMAAIASITFFAACKKDDKRVVDCSAVTGATFSTNSGKLSAILAIKCGASACHSAGGAGAGHWEWSADYNAVKPHFEHMLEAVEDGDMPEAGSPKLTEEELDLLSCWKESGYPE
jgi:uncharacterized membrane protein